jgi:hypothetical protein
VERGGMGEEYEGGVWGVWDSYQLPVISYQ